MIFQAQNLRGPVTTTAKLRYNAGHRVYIMKEVIPIHPKSHHKMAESFKFEAIPLPGEPAAVGGLAGEEPSEQTLAVGMIKVGTKSLFVTVMDYNPSFSD